MIFAGRDDEQRRFREWVETEPPLDRPAALLVGPPGSGKSALLRRFADISLGPRWFVFAAEINGSEATAAFFERLLADIHGLFTGRYLRTGPHDARLRAVLARGIPKVGDLLSALVKEDRRPAWQRLEDYLGAVSHALDHEERFVLLIDPDRALQTAQVEDWLTIANRVPPRVRIMLAQRPDDAVAGHPEAATRFGWFGDSLGDLEAATVKAWWDGEMTERLAKAAASWSPAVRDKLGASAYQQYRGYAFAHEALIRYLATTRPRDPLGVLKRWPREVENLFGTLYAALKRQGAERIRIALTLQVFGIPTPAEVWAQTAGLPVENLLAALADPAFLAFFRRDGEGYTIFHPLFAEYLERELDALPDRREQMADGAWRAIEGRLDATTVPSVGRRDFELLAAGQVAARWRSCEVLCDKLARVAGLKLNRGGLLESALADLQALDARCGTRDVVAAAVARGLGAVQRQRGELVDAEASYRKALAIHERLASRLEIVRDLGDIGAVLRRDRLDAAEQMCQKAYDLARAIPDAAAEADQASGLGLVYQKRGEADRAEQYHRRALEINESLQRTVEAARNRGNLGNVLLLRGDLPGAERMHRAALDAFERLERDDGVASALNNCGLVAARQGLLTEAEELIRKALAKETLLDRREGMANAHENLGYVAYRRGQYAEAEASYRHALAMNERMGRREGVAHEWRGLGEVFAARGDAAAARAAFAKARRVFTEVGMPRMAAEVERQAAELGDTGHDAEPGRV